MERHGIIVLNNHSYKIHKKQEDYKKQQQAKQEAYKKKQQAQKEAYQKKQQQRKDAVKNLKDAFSIK